MASLRQAGLRAGRHAGRGRHDPVQHVQRPRSMPKTRSTAPWAGCKHAKKRQPRQDHRRARLHGPEGSEADLRAGAVRRSGRRARASLHQVPELDRRDRGRRRASSMEVSLGPQGRQPRRRSSGASRATIRCATRTMRPTPFQAYRADHDRLRQVLHLLHRAQRPRPGAEPAAGRTFVAEVRQLADEGCREITLLGQTVNSYQHTRRRPHHAAVAICSTSCTRSTASSGSSSSRTIRRT